MGRQTLSDLRLVIDARDAEIEDLKSWVVTFLAPYAVNYSTDHGIDGLYPTHYDMLARCGARMVDFKRASIAELRA